MLVSIGSRKSDDKVRLIQKVELVIGCEGFTLLDFDSLNDAIKKHNEIVTTGVLAGRSEPLKLDK